MEQIIVLLQLVLALLTANPTPQNIALANSAVTLATEALAQTPVASSTVTYTIPTSTDNQQPFSINVQPAPVIETPPLNLGSVPVQPTCTLTMTFNGFDTGRKLSFAWTDTGNTQGTIYVPNALVQKSWIAEPITLPANQNSMDDDNLGLGMAYKAVFNDGAICYAYFTSDQIGRTNASPNAIPGSISTTTDLYGF